MSKIKLEDIQSAAAEQNWKVLSDTYKNLDTEMIFKCPEGHEVQTPWKKLRGHFECPICNQNVFKNQETNIISKKTKTTRVLVLDQATQNTGFSIFDNGELIRYGVYHATGANEAARIYLIKNWLINMITNWEPDWVGIEGIQFQEESSGRKMGVTVFQALARLQGVLIDTCYTMNVKYDICPTNTWRGYCGVKGRARADKKKSMQALAKQWYDVSVTDDEADAIGIGRYFSYKVGFDREVESWE